jgi:hypothetical protein
MKEKTDAPQKYIVREDTLFYFNGDKDIKSKNPVYLRGYLIFEKWILL